MENSLAGSKLWLWPQLRWTFFEARPMGFQSMICWKKSLIFWNSWFRHISYNKYLSSKFICFEAIYWVFKWVSVMSIIFGVLLSIGIYLSRFSLIKMVYQTLYLNIIYLYLILFFLYIAFWSIYFKLKICVYDIIIILMFF